MRVQRLEIYGFLGRKKPIRASFNDDLNIITGRNGAGKTNVLKLLWYVISGNILQALREVPFERLVVQTDEYTCSVDRLGPLDCRIEIENGEGISIYEDSTDSDGDVVQTAEDSAAEYLIPIGTSTFLPTFRRIEGGFNITSSSLRPPFRRTEGGFGIAPTTRPMTLQSPRRTGGGKDLEEALANVASRMSNGGHRFISALSTYDISEVLYRRYGELTTQYNTLQTTMSRSIVNQIKHYQIEERGGSESKAENLLTTIREEIEKVESDGDQIMAPFTEIQTVVQSLFLHKGIKVGDISFGETAAAINSEALSAGEKQMLSFISYNGLSKNSIIFIDEPELSLHVDWQRSLFGILYRQQTSNQFIIATHSPFIYSKYPDKEILLDVDRGNAENTLA